MYVVAFVAFVMLGQAARAPGALERRDRGGRGRHAALRRAGRDPRRAAGLRALLQARRTTSTHPAEILQIWAGGHELPRRLPRRAHRHRDLLRATQAALDHDDGLRGPARAHRARRRAGWATSSMASCRGGRRTCPGACGSRRWTAWPSRAIPRSSTSSPSRGSRSSRSCGGSPRSRGPPGPSRAPSSWATGCLRFLAEFARQPDDFLGLLAMGLSMGQWLSLPMIVAGGGVLAWAYRKA